MSTERVHLSQQELIMAADGELSVFRKREVEAHLASCWTCRARLRQIDNTIADFVAARENAGDNLPPSDAPRAMLKARMAHRAVKGGSRRWLPFLSVRSAVGLAAVFTLAVWTGWQVSSSRPSLEEVRAVPDPAITPGATLPVTRADVCAADVVESVRIVPVAVAHQVFAAYGIRQPEPRAWEVDYLITPALGGSDSIRNFWPQPYRNTVWNAHVKDALEDHLRQLVCTGELDLAEAQAEIARDWISAYRKHFHTDRPLPEHASFLKDRPWE